MIETENPSAVGGSCFFGGHPGYLGMAAGAALLVILGLSALMGRLVGSVPLAGILVKDIGMIFRRHLLPPLEHIVTGAGSGRRVRLPFK